MDRTGGIGGVVDMVWAGRESDVEEGIAGKTDSSIVKGELRVLNPV